MVRAEKDQIINFVQSSRPDRIQESGMWRRATKATCSTYQECRRREIVRVPIGQEERVKKERDEVAVGTWEKRCLKRIRRKSSYIMRSNLLSVSRRKKKS